MADHAGRASRRRISVHTGTLSHPSVRGEVKFLRVRRHPPRIATGLAQSTTTRPPGAAIRRVPINVPRYIPSALAASPLGLVCVMVGWHYE